MNLPKFLQDLIYLFYPEHCAACEHPLYTNEKVICTGCRHKLPLGNFHMFNAEKIEKVFYGRVKIENITSLLLFYKDGLVQNMMHNLKYRGQQNISTELGKWLGAELIQTPNYQNIDYVIPVPLHAKRLRERGYNQVQGFGEEIASSLNARYEDSILKKNSYNSKQSKKGRNYRWKNTSESFAIVNFDLLKDKHILLVDDIITTGATIEACINELNKIEGIKISVATMALTQ